MIRYHDAIIETGSIGLLNIFGALSASVISGTIQTPKQPNIQQLGNLNFLNVSGAVSYSLGVNLSGPGVYSTINSTAGNIGLVFQSSSIEQWKLELISFDNRLRFLYNNTLELVSLTGTGVSISGSLSANTLTGTLQTPSQPNVTGVGTLIGLNVNGDISFPNTQTQYLLRTSFTGGAIRFRGDSNTNSDRGLKLGYASASVFTSVIEIPIDSADVIPTVDNFIPLGRVSQRYSNIYSVIGTFTTILGTLGTGPQPSITQIGSLSSLIVTGTGSISYVTASVLDGTLATRNQPGITGVGTLATLNVSGIVTASAYSGSILTANQPFITQVGTLNGLVVSGVMSAATASAALMTVTGMVTASLGSFNNLFVNGIITGSISGSLFGNASTANTASQLFSADIRTLAPISGNISAAKFGFTAWDNNGVGPYADYFLMRGYLDASGGSDNLVMFKKTGLGIRLWQNTFGAGSAFSTFKDVAWTDGTNASGNWPITITTAAQPNITSLGVLTGLNISNTAPFINITSTVSTNYNFLQFSNGGGSLYIGQESSVAGACFPGSSAYASVYYSSQAHQFIVAGVKKLDINSGGINVTGTITGNVTGNLTGTVLTAAQGNITSLGTLTGLTLSGVTAQSWTGQTTSYQFADAVNSSGYLRWGIEGSAGAQLFAGASAYSAVLGNNAARSLHLGTNGTVRFSIDSAGAALFTGTVGGITTLSATTLNGILGTAAQTNITSLGQLTGLTIAGLFQPEADNTRNIGVAATGRFANMYAVTFNGALSGNATTATTLATARAINGVNFDGSAAITVAAAAGTLTGATLASGVTASSLTTVGTLTSLIVSGLVAATGGYLYVGAYAGAARNVGDIVARRAATTGVLYFGDSASTYLYFDGISHNFSGGPVAIGGAQSLNWTGYHALFPNDVSSLTLRSNAAASTGLMLQYSGGSIRGYFYADASGVGLLNELGGWSVRATYGAGYGGELIGAWTIAGSVALHAGNYNSYSPTLTGVGASGQWNINSWVNSGTGGGYRFNNPAGAAYATTASTVTGAIKIKFPTATWTTSPMIRLTVHIYEYTTGLSRTIHCGGHSSSGTFAYNLSAYETTDAGEILTVRFGRDGTANCIWIGETSRVWAYPQVFVSEVEVGFDSLISNWASGWDISFVTSFDTIDGTRDTSRPLTQNNYNTYSPTLTGTGASGTWGINVTGNAATLTNFKVDPSRNDPSDFNQAARPEGIYAIAGAGTNGPGASYGNLIHLVNSTDTGLQIYGGYINDELYFRGTSNWTAGTGWTSWRRLLHGGNYNSFSPTLTGTGASGTWSIAITGNAGSVSGYAATIANTANNCVVRDGSGDINLRYAFTGYCNSTDDTISTGMTYLMAKFGDNYHRSAPAAAVVTFLNIATLGGGQTYTSGPYSSDWFRSTGAAGWFNSTYAVGIYATQAGRVDVYNGAAFYSAAYLQAGTYVSAGTFVQASSYVRAGTYVYTDANYGYGLIGLYDVTKYRLIYAMGSSYVPAAGGTSVTGAYGLFFGYDATSGYINYTGNNLGHGIAIISNGTTVAYMASGIWTSGNSYAAAFYTNSSRALKQNINPFSRSALDLINSTTIYDFAYKNRPEISRVGFVAEETNAVFTGDTGDKFDTTNTIAILMKAVQELSDKITQLENR